MGWLMRGAKRPKLSRLRARNYRRVEANRLVVYLDERHLHNP